MTIRELHIFDFDATLFMSPMYPSDWEGHVGNWFDTVRSLSPPCVIDPSGMWIESTVSAAHESIADPEVYTVLMTGRTAKPALNARVNELLDSAGLAFDEVHLKPGGGTQDWKSSMILNLIQLFPDLETVQIWDDRKNHLDHFGTVVEAQGLAVELHFTGIVLDEPCVLGDAVVDEGLLREYVREIMLLTEAAKGPQDLPDTVSIVIRSDMAGTAKIYYADWHHRPTIPSADVRSAGEVDIVDVSFDPSRGPCGGAWKVSSANAVSGWGPMLYDVAIEYATLHANGLIADRDAVSKRARAVWNYYLSGRSDVTAHQLDDLHNTLTPEEEDNCDQDVSLHIVRMKDLDPVTGGTTKWTESPLSKRYTKEPTTMAALRAMGKLVES
ncbi:MAG TPA: DUF2410 domain-containing protein [Pseudomonadales bacterium]|nr:DUF2410 domain-containing protein [Pseudomonadales bacterium]